MANFGNPSQMFGPRHSSPNPTGSNNSPRPPNVGPIPNMPPIGAAGPQMRLFNPMNMPGMAPGMLPCPLPWGAGVMPGMPMVRNTVPPFMPPQMTVPGPPPQIAPPMIQSNTQVHSNSQDKQKKEENRCNDDDDKHCDMKHRHSNRRRHDEDKHRRGRHSDSWEKRDTVSPCWERERDSRAYDDDRHKKGRNSDTRDYDRKRAPISPGRDRDNRGSDRFSSGAILRDDRDEVVSNLDPRRSGGAILLEDGEIDSDGSYSLHEEGGGSFNGRRDDQTVLRTDNDHLEHNNSRFDRDKRYNKYSSRHDNDNIHNRHGSHHNNDWRHRPHGLRHDQRHYHQHDSKMDFKKKYSEDDRHSEINHRNDPERSEGHRGHSRDERRNDSDRRQVSDRSESQRGRSGAILRDDRDDGPVLLEDRVFPNTETGRTGAVLIEDRNDINNSNNLDDRGQRSRSDLDRNSQRRRFESDKNSRENESRRDFGRGSSRGQGRHFTDQGFKNSLDRDRSLEEPVEANIGRTGALLLEDNVGRTGALLLEDRNNDREDRSLVRKQRETDNGKIGRSGALLLDDRGGGAPVDRGQRGRGNSFRGQGHRGKSNAGRDRPVRHSSSRELKRSRSPSVHNVRVKREPKSTERDEPDIKKRKIWEPAPNDISIAKCIRIASQSTMDDMDALFSEQVASWVRCSAADLYFKKDPKTGNMVTTKRMQELEELFDTELVQRAAKVTALQNSYERPLPKPNWKHKCGAKHNCDDHNHDHSSPSSSDSSDSESDSEDWWMDELKFKQNHPYRLHPEVWYNDPNELNYGPLCRCSNKARQFGIRHSIYPGEKPLPLCDMSSNNLDKLYHYRVNVSPVKNFLINEPTFIMFDEHEYIFEGFSIFSHKPIPKFPDCQVIRFNIIYTIHVEEEQVPENFSVRSLDLFTEFLFDEILELIDIDWRGPGDGNQCRRYHIMPRFARPFPENGKELLSMNDVLLYLLKASKPLVSEHDLEEMFHLDTDNWTKFVDSFRHMVVTCPGKKPSSIRIDQLDKAECKTKDGYKFPVIIHHGVRPAQLSYAGDPTYRKKWREYMKYRHLLWTRCKVGAKEKEKLDEFEAELEKIRLKCTMKREVTAEIDSEGFLLTGIRADICQHAMLLPVLIEHLRFHECLSDLEDKIKYKFQDRSLLQLALTHSSYKVNYGTNPDHGRNSLSNCGFRQVKFGDFKIHLQHTRKRGLNILLKIMAKMGHKEEVRSEIPHNERLEFLGDAVVEFITSTHLFNMFPQASEGELTLYRGSLVQNAHLAVLADKLRLQDFLLYAHGPDLCHDSNLKHAMANCFEAFLGALFMDGGIKLADKVFSENLFHEADLLDTWMNTPQHPLISDEPNGDRHWIEQSPVLQKLTNFENDVGYEFQHIRLLAKAFTQRNVGYNNLTFGHNQRLEFLGDTVMQLICSEYLFRHFPDHHEGHLTLLRSSLVNNKTQATVAAELGMPDFVIKANMTKVDEKSQASADLKTKEKADLLEALLGALLVDGGLEPCKALIEVCFLPRLQDFILDQEWNDPKSELQQCCLTLREINDETPDIPVYKVLKASGPTNQRTYTVAVYFREKRLAVGVGGGIQQAEMKAAEAALNQPGGLFHNRLYNSKNKRLHAAASKLDLNIKKEFS